MTSKDVTYGEASFLFSKFSAVPFTLFDRFLSLPLATLGEITKKKHVANSVAINTRYRISPDS